MASPTSRFLNVDPLGALIGGTILAIGIAFVLGMWAGVAMQTRAERSARIFRECGMRGDLDYDACVASLDTVPGMVHDGDLGAVLADDTEEGVQ